MKVEMGMGMGAESGQEKLQDSAVESAEAIVGIGIGTGTETETDEEPQRIALRLNASVSW